MAGQLVTETLEYDVRLGEVLDAASGPCTMVLGVHGLADDDARLQEYSPGFDAERFAAHEKFFVDDVRRWIRSRFGVGLPAEQPPSEYVGEQFRFTTAPAHWPQDAGALAQLLEMMDAGALLAYASAYPHEHGDGLPALLDQLDGHTHRAVMAGNAAAVYGISS
ncbi:MAG TPA: hypothetical protein VME22_30410 [Solirubrobacteraceae bacterium]|nr:hypothetical protein [Solirubrobacteraceae bacterium]